MLHRKAILSNPKCPIDLCTFIPSLPLFHEGNPLQATYLAAEARISSIMAKLEMAKNIHSNM